MNPIKQIIHHLTARAGSIRGSGSANRCKYVEQLKQVALKRSFNSVNSPFFFSFVDADLQSPLFI